MGHFYIAADSRSTTSAHYIKDGKRIDTLFFSNVCKIRKERNYYYTGAGWQIDVIMDSVEEYLSDNKFFDDTIEFENNLKKNIQPVIEEIRNNNRNDYLQYYNGKFATIALFWFVNHTPHSILLDFNCTNSPDEQVKITCTRIIVPIADNIYIPLGETDKIIGFFNSAKYFDKNFNENKHILQVIQELVQLQVNDKENKIDCLDITPFGVNHSSLHSCILSSYQNE
jgi:hypothetical protein